MYILTNVKAFLFNVWIMWKQKFVFDFQLKYSFLIVWMKAVWMDPWLCEFVCVYEIWYAPFTKTVWIISVSWNA